MVHGPYEHRRSMIRRGLTGGLAPVPLVIAFGNVW